MQLSESHKSAQLPDYRLCRQAVVSSTKAGRDSGQDCLQLGHLWPEKGPPNLGLEASGAASRPWEVGSAGRGLARALCPEATRPPPVRLWGRGPRGPGLL